MTRENVEVEKKQILRRLVNKVSKKTGISVKRINTLLIYDNAKKAYKDPTILTTANAELLLEKE